MYKKNELWAIEFDKCNNIAVTRFYFWRLDIYSQYRQTVGAVGKRLIT